MSEGERDADLTLFDDDYGPWVHIFIRRGQGQAAIKRKAAHFRVLEQANEKHERQINGNDHRNRRTPCSRECIDTSQAQRPDRFGEAVTRITCLQRR